MCCGREMVCGEMDLFLRMETDGSNDPVSGRVGAGVYIPDFNVRVCKRYIY
jgi:hypothetical protein